VGELETVGEALGVDAVGVAETEGASDGTWEMLGLALTDGGLVGTLLGLLEMLGLLEVLGALVSSEGAMLGRTDTVGKSVGKSLGWSVGLPVEVEGVMETVGSSVVGAEDATLVGATVGAREGIPVGARETEGRKVGGLVVSMLNPESKIMPIKSSISLSACCLVASNSLRVPAGSDLACFQKSPRLKRLGRVPRRAAR
jgi:hypothetical protein